MKHEWKDSFERNCAAPYANHSLSGSRWSANARNSFNLLVLCDCKVNTKRDIFWTVNLQTGYRVNLNYYILGIKNHQIFTIVPRQKRKTPKSRSLVVAKNCVETYYWSNGAALIITLWKGLWKKLCDKYISHLIRLPKKKIKRNEREETRTTERRRMVKIFPSDPLIITN